MNCPSCGKNNPDNSGYCVYCGSAISNAPPQAQYAPPQTQYAPPQSQYTPPPSGPAPYVQNYYNMYKPDETVTMGEWFIFFLIMCIPIVNFIMLFVWGFGSGTKPSKANLCKLQLLMMAIGIGLALVVGFILTVAVGHFY